MILDINGIRFKYNGEDVLKKISFKIEGGNITGIVGPNGSGKTTLLKCINQILKPYKGTIMLDRADLKKMASLEIAKKIAYVPQMEGKHFPCTVFNTILMGRNPYISWAPKKKDLNRVAAIIRLLHLDEIAMRDINKLSGGQRQKVIIARALAQEPNVLLLDEPTANLDLKHQLEVMKILMKQSKSGILVFISIHDLNIAARYCDNIIMLKKGRIFAVGGKSVLNPENIESVYGIKAKILHDSGMNIIVPLFR